MINQRLTALREHMNAHGISAYIMPLGDPHQSEYPAGYWKSLSWISGFTGSAGTVMVTMDHAGLWADSRYFIQGEEELSTSSFELHKMHVQSHAGFIDYAISHLPKGSKIAIDGPMFSVSQKEKYSQKLSAHDIHIEIKQDFIGSIWTDRATLPQAPIIEHPVSFAGKSRPEKLSEIRSYMAEKKATHHLITTLDDIAWLYNLRGSDVECNPVFLAYTLLSEKVAYLYVDVDKLDSTLLHKLKEDGVVVLPYDQITAGLNQLTADDKILIHNATINLHLHEAITHAVKISGDLKSRQLKAVKNDTEINHIRQSMVNDGVALANAFYWLEQTLSERTVSEYELAMKLAECRAQQEHYFGESFNAIVGYKGNGAIIHYRPEEDTCAAIKPDGMLLVDSGGQYMNGTTDITRTFHMSAPTAEEKNAYTRVLIGHIQLAQAKFPIGTRGGQLDVLARQSLWAAGLNYGHGTGHGVGFFMNVHEPPQGFAPGLSGRAASVQEIGMVTSNEPGFYKPDGFGIRIENLVITKASEYAGFLDFETVTMYPIATNLIDMDLMSKDHIKWLNDYHA